jgi:glyoxylase-like metal-dependent hydrolase (beta-lactamase superfamily II)
MRLESVSSWFEIYQVNDSTFALLEPGHYEEVISYLILGDERAVLFDTGMGIANIKAEVDRLTRPTGVPMVVVNSHSHYDHIGDNNRFAEVWAFDDDVEVVRIERGKSRDQCIKSNYMRPDWYLDLPPGFDPAMYEIRPSSVTRRLHHLDVIDLGGRTLTVHHTPGHSPGDICLLDNRDGLLFTGDVFYTGMNYVHFEDSDFDAYLESLRYLVRLLDQVSHLCPSHNEAYVPKEALARMLDGCEQIATGEAEFELQDGIRVYRFEGFGLMAPHFAE